jgi:PEP-CTERM motif
MRFLKSLAALCATAIVAMAVPASATVINITNGSYTPESLFGGFHVHSVSNAGYTGTVGRFTVSGTDVDTMADFSVRSYCIDVFKGLYTYVDFTINPLSSFFSDPTKQAQVAALLVHADPLVDLAADEATKKQIASSIGLAVWELVYEPGTTGYSLLNGNFDVWGGFEELQVRADGYLANVENGTWSALPSQASVLLAAYDGGPLSQSQVFINASPAVPEPATWLSMILGFGVAGAAMRRRRHSADALAA